MSSKELLESVDILDYISQFTDLQEKNGEYWGLSPLKEENTPSFSVNTELQTFYDFSSGKGGNVISFIRYFNNCSTKQAMHILCVYAGINGQHISVPRMSATQVAKRYKKHTKARKESTAEILAADYMDRFDKCREKLSCWETEGISFQTMDKFQVRYDTSSDRLVYPIHNTKGDIINVSGRTLDKNWKNKKLRKYTYFKPLGALNTLYGLAENREEILRKHEIIIFEGAKSVMMADTWGIHNAAAILTSHLNVFQLEILAQLGCNAVFALDKDVNVREDENIKRLKKYVNVEYLWDKNNLLSEKMSPVDNGHEVWKTLYRERLTYR